MTMKTKKELRELFNTALCLNISINNEPRRNPSRSRYEPSRLINESTPPAKRIAISTPDISTPDIFSPATKQLLQSFSPATQERLKNDLIKDDEKIKMITGTLELDDPNYIHFNSNPKIGTDLELWVCVNIKCPGCNQKLYKYSHPGMPAVDVRCINSLHSDRTKY